MARMFNVLILLMVSCASWGQHEEEGKHWALLIAGSRSWYNYRHQVLKRRFVPGVLSKTEGGSDFRGSFIILGVGADNQNYRKFRYSFFCINNLK